MESMDDSRLLREYAKTGADAAFAELVARHVNLVYSVALRRVGNSHHAEEITQAVFIILAKKAASLHHEKALSSWLFQATRFTANNFARSEARRQRREQEAYMQSTFDDSGSDAWQRIEPLLDDAVEALSEKERRAIILRYYEGRNLREVGIALGTSEEAAKKRVMRAIEKLQRFFLKHGVASTAAAIPEIISAHSVQTVPAALAKSITLAVAKGTTTTGSTLTLAKGALKIMAWTKAKTAVAVGLCVLLAASTTTVAVKKIRAHSLDTYLQDAELNDVSNAPPMVAIQLTHFQQKNPSQGTILGKTDGTKEIGRDISLSTAILKAYGFPSFRRMICSPEVDQTRVDYLITVPDLPQEKFQAAIKRKLGYSAHVETRDMDVLCLRVKRANAAGLTPADDSSWQEWHAKHPESTGIHRHNITTSQFAEVIEGLTAKPVVDQTGLTGNYDFITRPFGPKEMNRVFIEELGLELVPGREPTEVLVVEKAQ